MEILSTEFLFSAKGRINRQPFWMFGVYAIGGWLAIIVASMIIHPILFAGALYGPVVGIASIFVQIKRWHDRGKSGWWWFIQLIPVVGPIWALVECGFLKGTDGDNEYGPDPLASAP